MKEQPIIADGHKYDVICITERVCYIDRDNSTYIAITKRGDGISVFVDASASVFNRVADFGTSFERVVDDIEIINKIINAVSK